MIRTSESTGNEGSGRGVLLINPPYGTLTEPYISIPVLASYLRSHGVPVRAFDAARQLVAELVKPENIRMGMEFLTQRFRELNASPQLVFSEMHEYLRWLGLLQKLSKVKGELAWLSSPFSDFSDVQQSPARELMLSIAASRYFPEITFDARTVCINGFYSPFSSSDLIKSAGSDRPVALLLRSIVEKFLYGQEPLIAGFSVIYPGQVIPAFQMAYWIRRIKPDVHITMGGPFITLHFQALKEKGIFAIVNSLIFEEGEIPLEELFWELKSGKPNLSKVRGLVYLKDDKIHFNSPAPPLDMEKSPGPDYTVFDLDGYLMNRSSMEVPFRLSKGCPWRRCTFCRTAFFGTRDYQQPSPDIIYGQLRQIIDETDLRNFLFSDESAHPLVLEHLSRRLIEDGIKIQWHAHTRIDRLLTRERCMLYREAGCSRMNVGIESLNERILALMKKGISAKLVETVLSEIAGVLPIGAYLITGFPTETLEEFREGYRKVEKLRQRGLISSFVYSLFSIYCDSEIWRKPERFGITTMHVPPSQDLNPDVVVFDCRGQSSGELVRAYNEMRIAVADSQWHISDVEELEFDGERLRLNFDLKRIISTQCDQCHYPLSFSAIREWLGQGDATVTPLNAIFSVR
jgi:anaerobic magnesium-protoporphyrin IX monomethyl ester cyclase